MCRRPYLIKFNRTLADGTAECACYLGLRVFLISSWLHNRSLQSLLNTQRIFGDKSQYVVAAEQCLAAAQGNRHIPCAVL